MVSDRFCEHVLSLFKQTTTCWAQLHTSDPGVEGFDGVCTDRRRPQIFWNAKRTDALVSDRALVWNQFQSVPGFPQTVQYLTIWSEPTDGIYWATLEIPSIRVPHLATLEIPAGLEIRLTAPQGTPNVNQ